MTVLPRRETCHPLRHGQMRGVYASILRSAISSQLEKKSRPFFYQLDGCIIKHVSNHPYLGFKLSESLTFSIHIANIVSSACQKLGFLRRNVKRCPRDVKALAYYALVRSRLEYCCAIWDPHQVGEINAARFVCSEYRCGPGISVTALLQQLQWPSFADRRLIARLTFFFTMPTQEKSISHCAILWIGLTPRPKAPKIITNTFLQKTLPLVNHSSRKL